MKKNLFIGLFILSFLGLMLFISHPTYVTYQAQVVGEIYDENGKPISNAKISRIGEKISSHPEFGYEVKTPYISDTVFSDSNGVFILEKKNKIVFTWFFQLTNYCNLNFEITKEGYNAYSSNKKNWQIENEHSLCNETIFKPKIVLKKN